MQTAIVTDSNSGIFEKEASEKNVFVVAMPIIIEGKTYYEGVNLDHIQFFQVLANHRKVSTSQPSPFEVENLWNHIFELGYDEIVYIPMSSGLSGSCETALALAQDYHGRVEVVNNHRISITLKHSVEDAIGLRKLGYNAHQIKKRLEETAYNSIVYVGVNTLEYLKASGRVTPAGAAIGTILSIKPLLIIKGERLDAYAKVRGTLNCQRKLIEAMHLAVQELSKDGARLRISVTGSYENQEDTDKWVDLVRKSFDQYDVEYNPLTMSVSAHVGPCAFGMGISQAIEK